MYVASSSRAQHLLGMAAFHHDSRKENLKYPMSLHWVRRRYVGGAPGKIDLYVGKEVVRRAIPMDGACDQLIELIKEHDRWQEKEVEEEPAGEREPQLA